MRVCGEGMGDDFGMERGDGRLAMELDDGVGRFAYTEGGTW